LTQLDELMNSRMALQINLVGLAVKIVRKI
jgi:hypothetical protein